MLFRSSKALPERAPDELKALESELPQQLEWTGDEYIPGTYSKNGHKLSSEESKLYLFDDLGVSQRWTNKFSEVGIETVGDLIGKTEDDLLHIDGIGAKAIEELRDGLEARNLLYILEPDEEDQADEDDLSQLLNRASRELTSAQIPYFMQNVELKEIKIFDKKYIDFKINLYPIELLIVCTKFSIF